MKLLFSGVLFCLAGLSPIAGQGRADLTDLRKNWDQVVSGELAMSDSLKVSLLNDLAQAYTNQHPDSAILFAKMALTLIRGDQNYPGMLAAYKTLANTSYILSNGIESYDYSLKVIEIAEILNDEESLLYGKCYLGLAFMLQDKIRQSIEVFNDFLVMAIRQKDTTSIARGYLDQSINYDAIKNYDSALHYANLCISISERANNNYYLAMGQNRKGYVLSGLGDYQTALENHALALKTMDGDNNWERAYAYAGMAQAYSGMNDLDKCVYYGELSLGLARTMNAKWEIKNVAEILSSAFAKTGNYRDAYNYHVLFKAYHDSIFNEENEQNLSALELKQAQTQRDALKHENELQAEILAQRNLQLLLVALIMIILVLFLGVLFYLYKSRKRYAEDLAIQRDKLNELNRSKDRILSVLAHDMRSPVNSILSLLHLMKYEKDEDIDFDELMNNIYERTVIVSNSLNGILEWSSSQFQGSGINPVPISILEIADEQINLLHNDAGKKQISLEHMRHSGGTVLAEPEHLRIIIRNLIANAIKFTPEGGQIKIRYRDLGAMLAIDIEDNGVGVPDSKKARIFKSKGETTLGTDKEKGTGLGLFLCNEYAGMNGGSLAVSDTAGGGATFSLILKKVNQ